MKKKQTKCENCGEQLTTEEIEYNSGWCFSCDLPEEEQI